MIICKLCLVNEKQSSNNSSNNTASQLIRALKIKKNKNTLDTSSDINYQSRAKEEDSNFDVWPIERKEEPLCEWKNNNIIMGGCFPFLFLRGCGMLPQSTFPISLIKHLFLYYDGRFQKMQSFAHLLFNQLMQHTAIRKVARTESSNKKYLENLGKLMKREDFKDALYFASNNLDNEISIALNNKLLRILRLIGKDLPFSAFKQSQLKAKFSSILIKYRF